MSMAETLPDSPWLHSIWSWKSDRLDQSELSIFVLHILIKHLFFYTVSPHSRAVFTRLFHKQMGSVAFLLYSESSTNNISVANIFSRPIVHYISRNQMKRKYSEERRCAKMLPFGGELSKGQLGSLKHCDFGGETLFVYQKKKRKKTDLFGRQMLVASVHFSRRVCGFTLYCFILLVYWIINQSTYTHANTCTYTLTISLLQARVRAHTHTSCCFCNSFTC